MRSFEDLRRRTWLRHVLVATCAVTFALLVSVAATHLHVGADLDAHCAICSAVVGKLEGPSAPVAPVSPPLVAFIRTDAVVEAPFFLSFRVVLPPACGPPAA